MENFNQYAQRTQENLNVSWQDTLEDDASGRNRLTESDYSYRKSHSIEKLNKPKRTEHLVPPQLGTSTEIFKNVAPLQINEL